MLVSSLTLVLVCLAVLALAFLPYDVKVEDYTDVADMETECTILNDSLVSPQHQAA